MEGTNRLTFKVMALGFVLFATLLVTATNMGAATSARAGAATRTCTQSTDCPRQFPVCCIRFATEVGVCVKQGTQCPVSH
jgi:hypothetical protein